MKSIGFFLLVSGWLVSLAALALLAGSMRGALMFGAFAVQLVGFAMLVRSHLGRTAGGE